MEFLVRIEIRVPADIDADEEARVRAAELARGQELRAAGILRRVWRVPGRRANWSLYECADASELHEVLNSLPMWPWLDIEVHPLAMHPLEDAAPR